MFEIVWTDPENHICKCRGDENDIKPTNVGDHSEFLEINSSTHVGKTYYFDKATKTWSTSV